MVNPNRSNKQWESPMNVPLFQGELVRLIAPEPQLAAGLHTRWVRDSEFVRLLDTDPARHRFATIISVDYRFQPVLLTSQHPCQRESSAGYHLALFFNGFSLCNT